MSVDNIGLQIRFWGTSNSMVTLTIFSVMYSEVVMGRVQQPLTIFTEPWDDFMVHGVNNPLPKNQENAYRHTTLERRVVTIKL